MYCNKYKVPLFDSFLCEECEDNPKVSTGYYKECRNLENMKGYIVVYYDNKFNRMKNIIYDGVITKTEVIHKFNNEIPKDCALVNIIEL